MGWYLSLIHIYIITDDGLENLLVKTVIDDFPHASVQRLAAVSYTHLDVYKRQFLMQGW